MSMEVVAGGRSRAPLYDGSCHVVGISWRMEAGTGGPKGYCHGDKCFGWRWGEVDNSGGSDVAR